MADINLHELANAPGAGKAAKALKAAGCWQERSDDGLPIWRVEVAVTKTGWLHVNVPAESSEAALKVAEKFCRDNPDWGDRFDEYDDTAFEASRAKPTHEPADKP